MIPLLPTLSSQPGGSGSAAGTTRAALTPPARQDPGATTAGRFAELFDALLPAAASPGSEGVTPGQATDAAHGQPTSAVGVPESGLGLTESDIPQSEGGTLALNSAGVLGQRAHHAMLSEPALQPQSITAAAEPEQPGQAAATGPAAVTSDSVTDQRYPFPVANVPGLILPWPGAAAPSQVAPIPIADVPMLHMPFPGSEVPTEVQQLPVAEVPLLVMPAPMEAAPTAVPQLPLTKAPLLILPVPGETAPTAIAQLPEGEALPLVNAVPNSDLVGPAAGVPGQSAAQQLAVSAAGVPDPAINPMPSPGNEAVRAAGEPMPAGIGQVRGPVPDAALTAEQRARVGAQEAATTDTATILVGVEPATGALATTPATSAVESAGPPEPHLIPLPVAMMGDQAAAAGALGRTSNDSAVASVGAADTAAETLPARTPVPQPLHRQMLGPIATLAAGPNGERTLSVNIAPEALGPITVKAHLGADGIRMELSAPTDAGREALRAMLPELRRELAATGHSGITVGAGQDAAATSGGYRGEQHGGGGQRSYAGTDSPAAGTRTEFEVESPVPPIIPPQQIPSHLDVMA